MDERNIRTERTTDVNTSYDRDVDIRRSMIMGRDLDYSGNSRVVATAPMNKVLRWGPIMGGLTTTLVMSLLLGSLFLGLGFNRSYGVFGGLTSGDVGFGAIAATAIAVFLGAYLTGYVSDLRSKAEGTLNGFMVGVMTILTPLLLGMFGAWNAAQTAAVAASNTVAPSTNPAGTVGRSAANIAHTVPTGVEHNVRYALTVAADNAWTVFLGGILILGLATLAGYLGAKSREKAIEKMVSHDLDRAQTL